MDKRIYRHEMKYLIPMEYISIIRNRLVAVLEYDAYSAGGGYNVRSLYYDTFNDMCLKTKINGCDERNKWRLRLYNYDYSVIKLECKHKKGRGIYKESEILPQSTINPKDVSNIKKGSLLEKFRIIQESEWLAPVCLIDYEREAFVFDYGTVRITIDKSIRVVNSVDVTSQESVSFPVTEGFCILEVKWTEYMPMIIKELLDSIAGYEIAVSKYALCRIKLNSLRLFHRSM